MCEVAELKVSLLSPSDEELGQLSAIQAQITVRITAVTGHVLTVPSKGRENVTSAVFYAFLRRSRIA